MSEYLQEIRDSVRQVVADTGLAAGHETVWPLAVELGWLLTSVPEELGGLDLGVAGTSELCQELGRGLTEIPYIPAVLALEALSHCQWSDKASWIERFTSGELVSAPLVDGELSIDRADADKVVVTGTATAVQSAEQASHLLVWDSGSESVLLLPMQAPGLEFVKCSTWDETRRLYDVIFNGVAVEPSHVLATDEMASELIARLRTLRNFALAADSVGAASALLELTVEHLQTREQFGRPLALFQALKHRCADMKTVLAGADAMLQDCLRKFASQLGEDAAELKSKTAKYLASTAFLQMAEEALQLHGGIGMADEHPCHLFLKRSLLSEHLATSDMTCEVDLAASFLVGTEV